MEKIIAPLEPVVSVPEGLVELPEAPSVASNQLDVSPPANSIATALPPTADDRLMVIVLSPPVVMLASDAI
jgi:hypothetical protein